MLEPPCLPAPDSQYHVSQKFTLYEHEPSCVPPYAHKNSNMYTMSAVDRALEMQPNGRLENCRRHNVQPLPDRPSLEVCLEQPLAAGLADLRYAQVWKVSCSGKSMVARFYDALYVHDDTGRYDIFKHIDESVALETSAYKALEDLQGVMVPRFLGCFLTMLAPPDGLDPPFVHFERSVHVILLEFIPGCDLRSLDSESVCVTHRRAILDAVLLAYELFTFFGVKHLDMAERNIILKPSPSSPTPFCDDGHCQLRFKVPLKSLLPGGHGDTTMMLSQIELPIAVIDFGLIDLWDAKERERLTAGKCLKSFLEQKKYRANLQWRTNFFHSWQDQWYNVISDA